MEELVEEIQLTFCILNSSFGVCVEGFCKSFSVEYGLWVERIPVSYVCGGCEVACGVLAGLRIACGGMPTSDAMALMLTMLIVIVCDFVFRKTTVSASIKQQTTQSRTYLPQYFKHSNS
eukprot:scaffold65635_cov46-Cyclotella_meneghiniana.AAC.1